MKKQLTSFALFIVLCVFGNMAIGQIKQTFKGTAYFDTLINRSATYAPNSITAIGRMEPFYPFHNNSKLVMKISDLKPDSTYHVWIDKKAITWTSDSTFILKRKP